MAVALATLLQRAADLSMDQLVGTAVARGCRHYEPLLAPGTVGIDDPSIPHEALGVVLLCGPQGAATFQAIRCGAMVLSDLSNSPQAIAEASRRLGVENRAAHIARLALEADAHPDFWRGVLDELADASGEEDFLPGISRFTSETRLAGSRRISARVWLRTRYAR